MEPLLILAAAFLTILVGFFILAARRKSSPPSAPLAYIPSDDDFLVTAASSCPQTPGPSGWAWVSAGEVWAAGAIVESSRSGAALTAVVEALEAHVRVPRLVLRTASLYAYDAVTRNMDRWAADGWVTAKGEPVKHRALIERALAARDLRRAAGLPDAIMLIVPADSSEPTAEWAKNCANRALRHARKGSQRRWSVGDGDFAVDLQRRPRAADKALG